MAARFRRFRYDEPTTLGRRVAELAPTLPNRCLVIVLSDLHDPAAVPALKLLAQRHDVVVLQLQDPAETGLRGAGFLRAGEAETGRVFVTRAGAAVGRPGRVCPRTEARRRGPPVVRTDRPFIADLRNFLKARNVLGRGKR